MKSDASNHLRVMESIYLDASMKCPADYSDLRDLKTIRSRVENEGISFLTITLPSFSADFERSLAIGRIDSSSFRSFRKYGAIPAFLRGMLSQIFDHESGRIIDDVTLLRNSSHVPLIVDCVRQICLAFKKVELDCTPKRVQSALDNFAEIERSFEMFTLSGEAECEFSRTAACLWDNIMGVIRLDMLVPRHGPGATSERISGNQKFVWRKWHERLEPYFPFLDTAYTMGSFDSTEFEKLSFISEDQESPVRVTPVPKTLKGPRIIAIEPVCMQFAQQGIRDALYRAIENSWMTRGHVNFRDQSINQTLAIDASMTGSLATIDLKDASDRVPLNLALKMFDGNPDLRDAIDACRSRYALMPDGKTTIGPLRKFASMGSALCFPVEAMYFYTICVMALLRDANLPVSSRNCYYVSRSIYVYGDDIIVPADNAGTVLDYLQKYNCKVNHSKTFVTGKFRESCGMDAYDGVEVTPTYIRCNQPKNRQQASQLISWVSTANHFYKKGYWRTASHMFSICEKILGPLPYVSETSGALGRISYLGYKSASRWNRSYQRLEIKAWVPKPVYRIDPLDGYAALSKSLHLCGIEDRIDLSHLERSALHGEAALHRRWVPTT